MDLMYLVLIIGIVGFVWYLIGNQVLRPYPFEVSTLSHVLMSIAVGFLVSFAFGAVMAAMISTSIAIYTFLLQGA